MASEKHSLTAKIFEYVGISFSAFLDVCVLLVAVLFLREFIASEIVLPGLLTTFYFFIALAIAITVVIIGAYASGRLPRQYIGSVYLGAFSSVALLLLLGEIIPYEYAAKIPPPLASALFLALFPVAALIISILKARRRSFHMISLIAVPLTFIVGLFLIHCTDCWGPTSNSRDARAISDIQQVRRGLELYHDSRGTYPVREDPVRVATLTFLEDAYMADLPQTSQEVAGPYRYVSNQRGTSYILSVRLTSLENSALYYGSELDSTQLGINCDDPVYCISVPEENN
jgi:hypothetical protein